MNIGQHTPPTDERIKEMQEYVKEHIHEFDPQYGNMIDGIPVEQELLRSKIDFLRELVKLPEGII